MSFAGMQRLGFSRRDRRGLQLSQSSFASSKMICDLPGITNVELRTADDAPVRDHVPNAKALFTPGAGFSPITKLLDRMARSPYQTQCYVA